MPMVDLSPINKRLRTLWAQHILHAPAGWEYRPDLIEWPKSKAELGKRAQEYCGRIPWPMQYPDAPIGGLIAIGMNPSLAKTKSVVDNLESLLLPLNGLDVALEDPARIQAVIEFERCMRDPNRGPGERPGFYKTYYGPISQIAQTLNIPWTAAELFAVRHTNQTEFLRLLGNHEPFAQAQLQEFNEMIKVLKPRVILVLNAGVRDHHLLGRWWPDVPIVFEKSISCWGWDGRTRKEMIAGIVAKVRATNF